MSTQYRAEGSKLVEKYCRTFGLLPNEVTAAERLTPHGLEWSVWCESRTELPVWGLGNNSENWQDGPRNQHPFVSRRKR